MVGGLLERDESRSNSSSMPPAATAPPVKAWTPLGAAFKGTGSHGDDDDGAFDVKFVSCAVSANTHTTSD